MTETEFYKQLCAETEEVVDLFDQVESLEDLCFSLALHQLTEKNLADVDFEENEEKFRQVFFSYNPRSIVGVGQYLAQLNHVLDVFKPERPSPYKNITKAVFLSAKYLSPYSSYSDYRDKIRALCPDEKSTLAFLENFRLEAGLPKMYFLKTCDFFSVNGILDVPVLTPSSKKILQDSFSLPDENETLYKKVLAIAKAGDTTPFEINARLEQKADA